ncbi:hypothetical protein TUM4630_00610 [Shewanella algidipiscicola]|uniref:Transposase n=1 Tax=Shewanella algidipiscicola TaxID=614070 RepID=A0ABQ4P265_9GAMM|nr:hypothetical protein TUM4630_00610 [Shewanella algidipiscicola]
MAAYFACALYSLYNLTIFRVYSTLYRLTIWLTEIKASDRLSKLGEKNINTVIQALKQSVKQFCSTLKISYN